MAQSASTESTWVEQERGLFIWESFPEEEAMFQVEDTRRELL